MSHGEHKVTELAAFGCIVVRSRPHARPFFRPAPIHCRRHIYDRCPISDRCQEPRLQLRIAHFEKPLEVTELVSRHEGELGRCISPDQDVELLRATMGGPPRGPPPPNLDIVGHNPKNRVGNLGERGGRALCLPPVRVSYSALAGACQPVESVLPRAKVKNNGAVTYAPPPRIK